MIDSACLLQPIYPDSPPLDGRSKALRRLVLRGMEGGGRGHPGSALSLIEILRVLYDDVLRFRADQPDWMERDRCILSKGHGCLALYALLADKGFFSPVELDTFCHFSSRLGGHPEQGRIPGVEASTGALGHGLSIGVGLAVAARLHARDTRVFVIMGDGEINEGAVWEAALTAAKHCLGNLIAVVDYNRLQSFGPTQQVLNLEPLEDKWRAFGFDVAQVDGHDVGALQSVFLEKRPLDKPLAVICHTIKGKGIALAENNLEWHHKSKLAPELFAQMQLELGEIECAKAL